MTRPLDHNNTSALYFPNIRTETCRWQCLSAGQITVLSTLIALEF